MSGDVGLVAGLLAANPGPAVHIAFVGVIVVIGLIVFVIVRIRRKREAAEVEKRGDQTAAHRERQHEPPRHHGPGRH